MQPIQSEIWSNSISNYLLRFLVSKATSLFFNETIQKKNKRRKKLFRITSREVNDSKGKNFEFIQNQFIQRRSGYS